MDSIPKNEMLEFPENILQIVRKEFDLDRPGRMDQAITALNEWMKKQNHFTRKDLPRAYLERRIIFSAGSMERTKKILDQNFTLRGLQSSFYQNFDIKADYNDSNIFLDAVLPKLTEDYNRVYLLKNIGQQFNNDLIYYFRFVILMIEYVMKFDYFKGIVIILDYTDTNLYGLIKKIDITQLQQMVVVLLKGYGLKIKGIHVITQSKAADVLVSMLKQVLSEKVGKRLQVHKNYESLHKVVSKDVLPVELGGNERSIVELHEKWVDILSSDEFQKHFQEMKEATTDEKYRHTDKWNEEYMGMPGTFRKLNLD